MDEEEEEEIDEGDDHEEEEEQDLHGRSRPRPRLEEARNHEQPVLASPAQKIIGNSNVTGTIGQGKSGPSLSQKPSVT